MDLRIARDVFRRRGLRPARPEHDPALGADAFVTLPAPAFVTGLRDWRSAAATSRAHSDDVAGNDWRPL